MINRLSKALLFVGLLGHGLIAYAQGVFNAEESMLDREDNVHDNHDSFLPIPVVITEPAVGYGGGLFGLFLHEQKKEHASVKEHFIPPPMTVFGGGGTQNGTWFVGGGHRHSWNNDSIRYLVALGYADINLDIYSGDIAGFGNGEGVRTQTKGYGGMQKLLFRIGDSPVFLGASQLYARVEISADKPIINRAIQYFLGNSSSTSGVGLVAEYDTTDNFFYPRNGLSLTGEYQFYTSLLGGDYRYDMLTIDGRYFLPLNRVLTMVIAGNYQALSNADSHLPPMARPYIALRGISRYRYQGDYVGAVQTQLEWQFSPRWTLQGFVGAGDASTDRAGLFNKAEVAWGSGFRYLIVRKFGIQMGLDVAFSGNEQAVYLNVGTGL